MYRLKAHCEMFAMSHLELEAMIELDMQYNGVWGVHESFSKIG